MSPVPNYPDPPLHSSAGLRTDYLDDPVVPTSDHPLRGWRRFGADLVYTELWPKVAHANPLVVYCSGRTRGRLPEDMMGLAPWAGLLLVHLTILVLSAREVWVILLLGAVELVLLPIFAAIASAMLTGGHLRQMLLGVTFEELLVTRLTPVDIVQGLSLRPLAIQAVAQVGFFVTNAVLALAILTAGTGKAGLGVFVYVALWGPLAWLLVRGAHELGGAYGLRAHLAVKDQAMAMLRALRDVLRLVPAVALGGAVLMVLLPTLCLVLGVVGLFLLPATLVFVPMWILRFYRNRAAAVIEECYEYPDGWWMRG